MSYKVSKTLVDVPVIGYKTFEIWFMEEGNNDNKEEWEYDLDNERSVKEFNKMFPYDREHEHIR